MTMQLGQTTPDFEQGDIWSGLRSTWLSATLPPAQQSCKRQGNSLRMQLIGTWTLMRYLERDIETGIENHPFGEHPLGLLLYTFDGYVSAQLQRRDRPQFADGDLLRASAAEYAAAGSTYIACSGRFFVDETQQTLSHEMAVSLFPNWLGQRQVRLVQVTGEYLQLSTDGPLRFNGKLKTATLTWRRAGCI